MDGILPRFASVRQAMAAVAATGLLCAALRCGDDVATLGVVIVGCTIGVAWLRHRDVASHRGDDGLATGWKRKVLETCRAIGVAALLVGLSDLAFLVGFFSSANASSVSVRAFVIVGRCHVGDPATIRWSTTMGLGLAFLVEDSLKRFIWRPVDAAGRPARAYLALWPVVVTSALGCKRVSGAFTSR